MRMRERKRWLDFSLTSNLVGEPVVGDAKPGGGDEANAINPTGRTVGMVF